MIVNATVPKRAKARAATMAANPMFRDLRMSGVPLEFAVLRVRRHWDFIASVSRSVRDNKKRTKAAKKGWKTRREKAL